MTTSNATSAQPATTAGAPERTARASRDNGANTMTLLFGGVWIGAVAVILIV